MRFIPGSNQQDNQRSHKYGGRTDLTREQRFVEFDSVSQFTREAFDYADGHTDTKRDDLVSQGITPISTEVWGTGKQLWKGGSYAQLVERVENGMTDHVEEAQSLMRKIECGLNLRGLIPRWQNDVAGVLPCVPSHLAGDPRSMRRRAPQVSRGQSSKIKVYYTPVVSGAIDHKVIMERGIVVLACVMAIAKARPVDLYMYSTLGKGDVIVKIGTNPMRMSEVAWSITNANIFRGLMYKRAEALTGWSGEWGRWSSKNSGQAPTLAQQRKQLEVGENDIVIPGMHVNEMNKIMKDPVAWINGILDTMRK